MSLTYGELFAGYGGLGMGVQSVLGGEMAWCAEFEAAPSKILAHHWPNVPNLGDVTKVDWASVPKVDVITGGSPCQDLSSAGKRAGMKAGTRSGLWASMCDAIDIIRPGLVVWENVRGALSAEADSALEQCPGCVGDGNDGPVLRALGRVLGDLADLGYDAWWYSLRAADVGGAHGRFRVFVFAAPAGNANGAGWKGVRSGGTAPRVGATGTGRGPGGPTADADCGRGLQALQLHGDHPSSRHGRGVPDERHCEPLWLGSSGVRQDWGQYAAAIASHERLIGRPPPSPTEVGPKGPRRLSSAFVEWLMGLPSGHVTDPGIGLSRTDQLKALGNGVVPQQAAAATRAFLNDISKERAA